MNLDQWFRRCNLKDFLSRALAALMLCGAEPFMQFLVEKPLWGTFIRKFFKFGPVVQEEMLFKEKLTYDGLALDEDLSQ